MQTLDILPTEVKLLIFEHLEWVYLWNCRLVSRSFYRVCFAFIEKQKTEALCEAAAIAALEDHQKAKETLKEAIQTNPLIAFAAFDEKSLRALLLNDYDCIGIFEAFPEGPYPKKAPIATHIAKYAIFAGGLLLFQCLEDHGAKLDEETLGRVLN
jgi:hypothetical protein